MDSMSARKQPRDADAAQLEDDDASQATTQDSHWLAGVNRQAQPQAQQHQLTASQAAGAKRTANAMSTDERKAKRAAHAREVRAQQAAERATAAAAARAEAAAAQLPEQAFLNELIDEDNHTRRNDGGDWERMQHCDNVEWVAFKKYVTVDIWSEIKPVDLEPDGFFDLFKEWRESDEYNHAILGWPTPSSQLQQPPLAPKTPAEVRQQLGPCQPSPPPPDDGDDPWGGGSADMYYEGLEEWDNRQHRERKAERAAMAAAAVADTPADTHEGASAAYEPHPSDLRPGQSIDDWWDTFYDLEYARAAGELPFNAIPLGNGIDASDLTKYLRSQAMERQAQREADRIGTAQVARERAAGPPPRREQSRYGPRGDTAGDKLFRTDREDWYERFTGRSITGVSLQEQNELYDVIARRFREYTDGRPTALAVCLNDV